MRRLFYSTTFVLFSVMLTAVSAQAQFRVIAGSFQGWSPSTGTILNDIGDGFFQATITGLNPGEFHEFKILETQELPADWGNPEWTATNNWFRADNSGSITIRLNTNVGSTGENNPNVGTSSTNWTPQLVGNFMVEAGGAEDWNPADSLFDMSLASGTQWTKTITVSTPGDYLLKLVTDGTFQRQFNLRGYADLFAEDFSFTTTQPNEQVIVTFDSFQPSLTIQTASLPTPTIVNHGIYHVGFANTSVPSWTAIDTQKQMVRRGAFNQLMTLNNLTNTTRGINGVVLDFEGLTDVQSLVLEFSVSPTGAFDEELFPISSWQEAPSPHTPAFYPGEGLNGSDRVLVRWDNHQIANQYLCIKAIHQMQVIDEFVVGHLLGETTGVTAPATNFAVSFADITPIRGEVGNNVDAGSGSDIDKSGTVSFADISAMRGNVGAQLTQIAVPQF